MTAAVTPTVTAGDVRRLKPWVKCPVPDHPHRVGVDEEGHLTGRCPDCAAENANGIRQIKGKR